MLKKNLSFFICFGIVSGLQAQTNSFRFDFGDGKVQPGYLQVLPGTRYTTQLGYGFDFDTQLRAVHYTGKDPLRDDYITADQPFYFSVKLPEGNYRVKLILGDKNGTSVSTIKAECRRLMVEKLETGKGKFTMVEFIVHVKDSIIRTTRQKVRLKPREITYLHWDDRLTLEFNNKSPKVCAVEISPVNVPTVFLAGNSTVVDQAEEPWAAWGQMIPAFFSGKIAVANYAESGETLRAFKGERRLDKLWSMSKPGD
jgi:hypothetical protein